ncbi:modulator of smoothened protein-like [Antedon mediterranea]|uniref:modulator of smoothened protein-like n=1 Tax=Antedon mediterranea TaxID=105859 RepID=UPI003AF59892
MDKLVIISAILFIVADVFALASLGNPEWVISQDYGDMKFGLTKQCQTIYGRSPICMPPSLCPEWKITLTFIIIGIACLTMTCFFLLYSLKKVAMLKVARWTAFVGMVVFCIAALIFPTGFYVEEIGGEPYKLPDSVSIGTSYIMFIMSIFLTIVSLLFAGKICLPMLYV